MIFTKQQVFDICDIIAPKYSLTPSLVKALCLQEGAKSKDGSFAPDKARLEQGFYLRYTEGQNLPTTVEILLAASYGVTQMMGQSLKEIGYFNDYFKSRDLTEQIALGNPLSQFAVPHAIDAYCVDINAQIEYGCKWFKKKLDLAHGDIFQALCLWNGDRTGKYANEVLDKQRTV